MNEQEKRDYEFYKSLKEIKPKPIKRIHRGYQYSDKEIEETKSKILDVLPYGFIFNGRGLEKRLQIKADLILIAMSELRQDGEIVYASKNMEAIYIPEVFI